MATGKKSFVLYADQKSLFDKLPNEKAGELIKYIFSYINDENPEIKDDLLLEIAFDPIKRQLKRDLENWDDIRSARSEAGKRGMASRWGKGNDNKNNKAIKPITKITVTDTVNVTDNVNENVNVNEKKNTHAFDEFWELYPKKTGKGAARKAWKKIKKPSETLLAIKKALAWQVKSRNWLDEGGRFIPYPATYLNAERWEDEVEKVREMLVIS